MGSGNILGPCTVKKSFPMKPGDKSAYVIVMDATGESALKIWGPAGPALALTEGQIITVVAQGPKGSIQNQEYNGKWALNANSVRVDVAGGASVGPVEPYVAPQAAYQAPAQSYSQPSAQAPQGAPAGQDQLPLVAARAARGTALYIDELVVNHGFTKDEAMMLAVGAHSMFPLYWGGEKFLR